VKGSDELYAFDSYRTRSTSVSSLE